MATAIQREFKQERVANPSLRITKRQIIEFLESRKDDEGRLPVRLDDVNSNQEDVLHNIASISQSSNGDHTGRVVPRRRWITMTDLLKAELIQAGDNWRISYKGEVTWGRITDNGKLRVNGETYPTPSAAAKAAIGRGCSGWDYWHFKDKHGQWTKVTALRDEWDNMHKAREIEYKECEPPKAS